MSDFVLDNSISMRWHLATKKRADQSYADSVLKSLSKKSALVPELWHLEAVNVLVAAEKRHDTNLAAVEGFISQLEKLPIYVDSLTATQAFSRTITLSRKYNLSSYDAAYLELAMRECLPLATLDKNLKKAAHKAGVTIYLAA